MASCSNCKVVFITRALPPPSIISVVAKLHPIIPSPVWTQVASARQDNKKMKRSLEEEQRARKDLEKVVRRVLKSMNDPTWDETNLWTIRSFGTNRTRLCATRAPIVHRPFRFDIPQTAPSLWEFGRKALFPLPTRSVQLLCTRLEGETKTFCLQVSSSLLSSGTSVVLQWY